MIDVPRGVQDCSWKGGLIKFPSSSRKSFLNGNPSSPVPPLSSTLPIHRLIFPLKSSWWIRAISALLSPSFSSNSDFPLFHRECALSVSLPSYSFIYLFISPQSDSPVLPRGAVPPLLPFPLRAPQPCPAHLHPSKLTFDLTLISHPDIWNANFIWNGRDNSNWRGERHRAWGERPAYVE